MSSSGRLAARSKRDKATQAPPTSRGGIRPSEAVLLAALLALALLLRWFPNNSGLVGEIFPRHDEVHYVSQVVSFLNGDWGIDWFINPAFFSYVLWAAVSVVGRLLVFAGEYESWSHFVLSATLDPYLVTIVGRCLSIFFSAAGVALAYLAGRALGDGAPRLGLLAASALAVHQIHADRAVLAGNESLLVFLTLLFFLALLRFVERPGPGPHALAGFVLGLAIGTKYNAGVHLVPLSLATAFALRSVARSGGGRRLRDAARSSVGLLLVPIGFLAATPGVLADPGGFVAGFREMSGFLHSGFTAADAVVAERGWITYLRNFPSESSGRLFAIACGIGILWLFDQAVRKRQVKAALLLAATVPAYLFLGSGVFSRMRFLLPAIPFVLMAGAWWIDHGLDRLERLLKPTKRWTLPASRAAIASAVCLLLFLGPGLGLYRRQSERYGAIDGRRDLAVWVRENLEPSGRTVDLGVPEIASLLTPRWRALRWTLPNLDSASARERETVEAFLATAYPTVHLARLLEAPTLELFKERIVRERWTRLVLIATEQGLETLERLPLHSSRPSIRHCLYWDELLTELKAAEVAAVDSGDYRLRVYRLDLLAPRRPMAPRAGAGRGGGSQATSGLGIL